MNELRNTENKMKRQRIKSTNEFISILRILNPSVEVVGEYVSTNTPILVKCKLCDKLFYKKPNDLKNGLLHNCTKQKWVKPMFTKKQSESLVNKIHNVYWNKNNIEIFPLSDSYTDLKCKCKKCGNEWDASLDFLSKECVCSVCNTKKRIVKTSGRKEHLYKLFLNSYGIRLLSKSGSTLHCHCDICDTDFKIDGYMKRMKISCPNCKVQNKMIVKSGMSNIRRKCEKMEHCVLHNDFLCKECLMMESKYYSVDEVFDLISELNQSISIVSSKPNLIDAKTEIECECKICGNRYITRPVYLLNGFGGCRICSMSKGEREIRVYLENKHIDYVQEKSFDDLRYRSKLRFDFYLPTYRIAIEYDGLQHFKPVNFSGNNKNDYIKIYEEQLKRDKLKNLYCEKNKILLIRIKYNENVASILDNMLFCNGSN